MNENYKDLAIFDLDEFKSRIASSINFIGIMINSEAKKVKKSDHLLNIYNNIDDKDMYLNNLKSILYRLSIMNSVVNNDMNNYNVENNVSLFMLYPEFNLDYLTKIDKETFISWFNVVINNHISVTKKNMSAIDKQKVIKL